VARWHLPDPFALKNLGSTGFRISRLSFWAIPKDGENIDKQSEAVVWEALKDMRCDVYLSMEDLTEYQDAERDKSYIPFHPSMNVQRL